MEQQNEALPGYWESVGLAAGVVGVLSFIFELALQYLQIGSDGSLTVVIISAIGSFAVCLFGALGGMFAIWHYAKTFNITLELGKGALIGFFTGVGIVVIGIVLQQMWSVVDPDLNRQLMDSLIATYENMELPEDMKQMMIDSAAAEAESPAIGSQLFFGILVTGILNLLSGMLGVTLFAREK